jgi:hypothetical protein
MVYSGESNEVACICAIKTNMYISVSFYYCHESELLTVVGAVADEL